MACSSWPSATRLLRKTENPTQRPKKPNQNCRRFFPPGRWRLLFREIATTATTTKCDTFRRFFFCPKFDPDLTFAFFRRNLRNIFGDKKNSVPISRIGILGAAEKKPELLFTLEQEAVSSQANIELWCNFYCSSHLSKFRLMAWLEICDALEFVTALSNLK